MGIGDLVREKNGGKGAKRFNYTDEELLKELRRFKKENGKVTSMMFDSDSDYPSVNAIQSHFGSWNQGLEKADLEINHSEKNSVFISDKELQIIVGNVLGDATVENKSDVSCRYRHDDTYRSYLEHLKEVIPSILSDSVVKEKNKQDIFYVNSSSVPELNEVRRMFYRNGSKVFPKSLWFTPLIVKYWYITDGSLRKERYPEISCNWILGEEQRVKNKMESCIPGLEVSIRGPYTRSNGDKDIALNFRGSENKFFEYVGECPVGKYEYKWRREGE